MKWVMFVAAMVIAGPIHAQGDPAAGRSKAAVCAGCHGKNGISKAPLYPNIAGQKEQYLVSSLKAYRDGKRDSGNSGVMYPVVENLSNQDIRDLAAYYASLSPCDCDSE